MASPLKQPPGLFHALQSRQIGHNTHTDALAWNESTVRKLFADPVLSGHAGCVNRLAWNETGDLLASAGDDTDVRLWPFPDSHQQGARIVVPTLHEANIFGIQFLPQSNSSKIITGAMDNTVQLHVLINGKSSNTGAASPASPSTRAAVNSRRAHLMARSRDSRRHGEDSDDDSSPEDTARTADAHTTIYSCHRGRVKEVQIHPEEPDLFWSVSEDGSVRQFDTREPKYTQQHFRASNVLLTAHSNGASKRILELKSLSFNPLRPMQFAIGASDHFVRLYDRRKLSLTSYDNAMHAGVGTATGGSTTTPRGLTAMLMPPHAALGPIARGQTRGYTPIHPTHLTFGGQGNNLLATYHGDHAYAWTDLLGGARESEGALCATRDINLNPASWDFHRKRPTVVRSPLAAAGAGGSVLGPGMLPPAAERHRTDGNLALFQRECLDAIRHYTAALRAAPESSVLYASRALAYLLRSWVGDKAEALRDAEEAVRCDPSSALAQIRRAQALRDCQLPLSAAAAARLCRACLETESERGGGGEFEEDLRKLEKDLEIDLQTSHARRMMRQAQHAQRREGRRRCGLDGSARRRRRSGSDLSSSPQEGNTTTQGTQNENENGSGSGGRGRGHNEGEAGPELSSSASGRSDEGSPSEQQQQEQENQGNAGAGAGAGDQGAGPSSLDANIASGTAAATATLRIGRGVGGTAPLEGTAAAYDWSSSDDEEERLNGNDPFGVMFAVRIDEAFSAELEKSAGRLRNGQNNLSSQEQEQEERLRNSSNRGNNIPSSSSPRLFSASPGPSTSMAAIGRDQTSAAPPWLWGALPSSSNYLQRFVGHFNLQTDIKEAVFLGRDDAYVAAGSDDGRVFLYETATGTCLRTLLADEDVVNCIRPHPFQPILATSGIDATIKLWSPSVVAMGSSEVEACCAANQQRLREGPRMFTGLDARLLQILSQDPELFTALASRLRHEPGRGGGGGAREEEEEVAEEEEGDQPVQCRVV